MTFSLIIVGYLLSYLGITRLIVMPLWLASASSVTSIARMRLQMSDQSSPLVGLSASCAVPSAKTTRA